MERELGIKAIGAMQFADDDKGEVRAVVYKLGEVDGDREVVLPPGFQGEAQVKLSHYGHSAILGQARGNTAPTEAPVGKGVVSVNAANEVEFRGKYFMSTVRGREAYFTAKEMGAEQEWSFTFWRDGGKKPSAEWSAKGAKRLWDTPIEPFEVSPVTIAAAAGTRTIGVKEGKEVEEGVEVQVEAPEKPAEPPARTEAGKDGEVQAATIVTEKGQVTLIGTHAAADAAEVQRLATKAAEMAAAEAKAEAKLREDIEAGVERFQRTRRLFNL